MINNNNSKIIRTSNLDTKGYQICADMIVPSVQQIQNGHMIGLGYSNGKYIPRYCTKSNEAAGTC